MANVVALLGYMATTVEPLAPQSPLLAAFWRWAGRCLQPHTAPDVAGTLRPAMMLAPWSRLELTAQVLQVRCA